MASTECRSSVGNEQDVYSQNLTVSLYWLWIENVFPFRTDIIIYLMRFPFLISNDVNNEKCLKLKTGGLRRQGSAFRYDSRSITWHIMIDKRAIIQLLFPFLLSRLWDSLRSEVKASGEGAQWTVKSLIKSQMDCQQTDIQHSLAFVWPSSSRWLRQV